MERGARLSEKRVFPSVMMSIVCLLPVRNGAEHLPRFFASAARFADAVIALDDGSTDETRDMLAAQPLVKRVLANPRRENFTGWDDSANRQHLLDAAQDFSPTWIVFLDADEAFDATDASALREFLYSCRLENVAFGFKVFRMLGDGTTFDDTGGMWGWRAFSYAEGQRMRERRLHFPPIPVSIPENRWLRTTVRIQHFNGTTEERRQLRYQKYQEIDPDRQFQPSYENLLAPPTNEKMWALRPTDLPVLLDRPTGFMAALFGKGKQSKGSK